MSCECLLYVVCVVEQVYCVWIVSVFCIVCVCWKVCVSCLVCVLRVAVFNVSCVQDVLEKMDSKKLSQFKELLDRDVMQGKACTNSKIEGSSSVQSAQGKNMKHFPCSQ